MSFIMCICGQAFSIMMGDGRMMDLTNNRVVEEKVMKVTRINQNVMIGNAGDPIPMSDAIQNLFNQDYSTFMLEDVEEYIVNYLQNMPNNALGVKMIITGRNRNNQFAMHVLKSSNDYEAQIWVPQGADMVYSYIGNNEQLCNQIISYHMNKAPILSLQQVADIIAACIVNVAQYDNHVNTNIFGDVIQ